MDIEKYNLIDTLEKLEWLNGILMDGKKPRFKKIAFDTETNGVRLHKSVVVGYSLAVNKDEGYYIPLLVWEADESTQKTRTLEKVKFEMFAEGRLKCIWTGKYYDEFVEVKEFDPRKECPIVGGLLKRWLCSGSDVYMWNAPFDVSMTQVNLGVDLREALYLDGSLLVHVLDENHKTALKENAVKYAKQLGIDAQEFAAQEKRELRQSILNNGGNKAGQVWRADLEPQMKYACADAFFTFGICEAALEEFKVDFGDAGMKWFFEEEVMPVCKEVVCDMKLKGVFIDVPHFERLNEQNNKKLLELEDQVINSLNEVNALEGFTIGKSVENISKQALLKELFRIEGLPIPQLKQKDGSTKNSFAKAPTKKMYNENPHWLYGYILGEDEIQYSEDKLLQIKNEMYAKTNKGKRYQFNIGSTDHLRWLFFEKYGNDPSLYPQTDSATKENPLPKMGAEILTEYFLKEHPWIKTLVLWKKLSKLQSTYVRPALELHIDGWLYVDLKQNGTITGRFAGGGGYNLQNMPSVDKEMDFLTECGDCGSDNVKIVQEIECIADCHCNDCGHVLEGIPRSSAIKAGFIAPKGYKIVNADFTSLEPKCFAYMSNEDALKEVYLKGLDLYSQVYIQLYDEDGLYSADENDPNFLKRVAKHLRNFIKPVVLAIPYGAEAGQVAVMTNSTKQIKNDEGKTVTIPDFAEGQRIMDAYLGGLPNLAKYMRDQENFAMEKGYVESLFGRRVHLPNAKIISDAFKRHDLDPRLLLQGTKENLNKRETAYKARKAKKNIVLRKDLLEEIRSEIGISVAKLQEKGYWRLIKHLLKSDLNNAKNNPIQMLASHITNRSMLDANRWIRKCKYDARVLLNIHDEVMLYALEEYAEKAVPLLRYSMEKNDFALRVDVPMRADPTVCDNMMEAK